MLEPSDWRLVAEGNAHLVYRYIGLSNDNFTGMVLKLQKNVAQPDDRLLYQHKFIQHIVAVSPFTNDRKTSYDLTWSDVEPYYRNDSSSLSSHTDWEENKHDIKSENNDSYDEVTGWYNLEKQSSRNDHVMNEASLSNFYDYATTPPPSISSFPSFFKEKLAVSHSAPVSSRENGEDRYSKTNEARPEFVDHGLVNPAHIPSQHLHLFESRATSKLRELATGRNALHSPDSESSSTVNNSRLNSSTTSTRSWSSAAGGADKFCIINSDTILTPSDLYGVDNTSDRSTSATAECHSSNLSVSSMMYCSPSPSSVLSFPSSTSSSPPATSSPPPATSSPPPATSSPPPATSSPPPATSSPPPATSSPPHATSSPPPATSSPPPATSSSVPITSSSPLITSSSPPITAPSPPATPSSPPHTPSSTPSAPPSISSVCRNSHISLSPQLPRFRKANSFICTLTASTTDVSQHEEDEYEEDEDLLGASSPFLFSFNTLTPSYSSDDDLENQPTHRVKESPSLSPSDSFLSSQERGSQCECNSEQYRQKPRTSSSHTEMSSSFALLERDLVTPPISKEKLLTYNAAKVLHNINKKTMDQMSPKAAWLYCTAELKPKSGLPALISTATNDKNIVLDWLLKNNPDDNVSTDKNEQEFIKAIESIIEHGHSRFTLHQYLKEQQKKIGYRSQFVPEKFFGHLSDRQNVGNQISALLDQPQNNWRLFIDGTSIHWKEEILCSKDYSCQIANSSTSFMDKASLTAIPKTSVMTTAHHSNFPSNLISSKAALFDCHVRQEQCHSYSSICYNDEGVTPRHREFIYKIPLSPYASSMSSSMAPKNLALLNLAHRLFLSSFLFASLPHYNGGTKHFKFDINQGGLTYLKFLRSSSSSTNTNTVVDCKRHYDYDTMNDERFPSSNSLKNDLQEDKPKLDETVLNEIESSNTPAAATCDNLSAASLVNKKSSDFANDIVSNNNSNNNSAFSSTAATAVSAARPPNTFLATTAKLEHKASSASEKIDIELKNTKDNNQHCSYDKDLLPIATNVLPFNGDVKSSLSVLTDLFAEIIWKERNLFYRLQFVHALSEGQQHLAYLLFQYLQQHNYQKTLNNNNNKLTPQKKSFLPQQPSDVSSEEDYGNYSSPPLLDDTIFHTEGLNKAALQEFLTEMESDIAMNKKQWAFSCDGLKKDTLDGESLLARRIQASHWKKAYNLIVQCRECPTKPLLSQELAESVMNWIYRFLIGRTFLDCSIMLNIAFTLKGRATEKDIQLMKENRFFQLCEIPVNDINLLSSPLSNSLDSLLQRSQHIDGSSKPSMNTETYYCEPTSLKIDTKYQEDNVETRITKALKNFKVPIYSMETFASNTDTSPISKFMTLSELISLTQNNNNDQNNNTSSSLINDDAIVLWYRLSVVDLDLKRASKIPEWKLQLIKILECFDNTLRNKGIS